MIEVDANPDDLRCRTVPRKRLRVLRLGVMSSSAESFLVSGLARGSGPLCAGRRIGRLAFGNRRPRVQSELTALPGPGERNLSREPGSTSSAGRGFVPPRTLVSRAGIRQRIVPLEIAAGLQPPSAVGKSLTECHSRLFRGLGSVNRITSEFQRD